MKQVQEGRTEQNRDSQLKEFIARVIDRQQKELENNKTNFVEQLKSISNGKKLVWSNSK